MGCRGSSGCILRWARTLTGRRDSEGSEPPSAVPGFRAESFDGSLLAGGGTGLGGGKGKMAWELGMEDRLRGMKGRGDPALLEWGEKVFTSTAREEW